MFVAGWEGETEEGRRDGKVVCLARAGWLGCVHLHGYGWVMGRLGMRCA
jgi:hypothetical protein